MKRRDFIKSSLLGIGALSIPITLTGIPNKIILSEYERCKDDLIYFIERYCYQKDPMQGDVLIKLTDQQKEIINDIDTYQYNLFNKSRQIGMSIVFVAYSLWKNIFYDNVNIGIMSVSMGAKNYLIEKYKIMYDNLPEKFKILKESNKYHKKYKNDSQIQFMSRFTDLKSWSFDYLFLDEYAFFNNDRDIFISAIPITSKMIISSTPNGKKNHFYKLWKYKNNFNKKTFRWNGSVSRKNELKKYWAKKNYKQEILAKFI